MTRPVLLDLFCGAGGSARGYQQAGFYVVGVDNEPQPRYCGDEFVQADALAPPFSLSGFAAIHASPPCQAYSRLRHLPWLKDRKYWDSIPPTLEFLAGFDGPWVVENVCGAPLEGITLCGQMFGLPLYRHRLFASSTPLTAPAHQKHTVVIGHGRMLNDRRKGSLNNSSAKGAWGKQRIVTVAGGQFKKADGERAMGIDWMLKRELNQAIPPAYTEFVGAQLMQHIGRTP